MAAFLWLFKEEENEEEAEECTWLFKARLYFSVLIIAAKQIYSELTFKNFPCKLLLCVCVCVCVSCSVVSDSLRPLQAPLSMRFSRILEWVAIAFSRGSSQPRDRTLVSCNVGRFFTIQDTREAKRLWLRGHGSCYCAYHVIPLHWITCMSTSLFMFRALQKMWNPSRLCWDILLLHRWDLQRIK